MKKISKFAAVCGLAAMAMTANAATFVGDRTDFRDETIYFAMTTRFYDGDPKNNVLSWDKQDVQKAHNDPDWRGDFKGLIEKLDYIKSLGFTAVWITPVVQNASGEDYHGYHSMDFSSVDLRYESRKEWGCAEDVKFQDLIDAAHAKGMKIILDVVLQHTSNFGEVNLNPLFTRNQQIWNQATPAGSLIPNPEKFSANYFEQDGKTQYELRWKYFKNPQFEPNNYYHHYGTGWNWDLPNRWWGQIAGDCVDLNTENDYVAQYIVDCYGQFIAMGVDGFRIDTTGHIAPLTFNKQFIPQFLALGEQYKSKRLNGCDFFMFGECCQRFQGSVVYRDQPNLSSYFYTWKSDESLLNQYDGNADWWRQQVLPEGHDTPVGPMAVCESDTQDKPTSNNVLMSNGAWHQPDYSKASGFSVIDFPMHYSFNNANQAIDIALSGDKKYNDASFNVVYVDSHDYCPGPNDGTRFNGGTEQWAENLSLMFTFRGIPCIYYGSEVEFKKGMPIDVGGENNKTPRSQSGRAYFGAYLEGNVTASDFGQYSATGNVAKTLNGDLSQHIRRLNLIRAAVPALRKGQYTRDGVSGNSLAFKRAYQNSYALVCINGGATFSNVPSGTYVDLVTGQSYTPSNGTIQVSAPSNKGQLRVLVKDWNGGKVGEDGKFIYASSPVAKGGSVEFPDEGTTEYYTAEDVVGNPSVKFSPAGTSFKTETLKVTASLSQNAASGWYKVGNGSKENLNPGQTKEFTIGQDMAYGESVTVTWGADEFSGQEVYRKVDPNAVITVYVTADQAPYLYAWEGDKAFNGTWPGKQLSNTEMIDGRKFYYMSFPEVEESLSIIFNNGNGAQTGDITGITADVYYEYDGGSTATPIEVTPGPKAPVITANPRSGAQFNDQLTVTLTASPATDIYYTLNGSEPSASSTRYNGPITLTSTTTIKAYAKNEIGETRTSFTYTKVEGPIATEWTAYFDNSLSNWGSVSVYAWDAGKGDAQVFGAWPGRQLTETIVYQGMTLHKVSITPESNFVTPKIIFNGDGQQTADLDWVNGAVYNKDGKTDLEVSGISSFAAPSGLKVFVQNGMLVIEADEEGIISAARIDGTVFTLPVSEGRNNYELPKGFYIVAGSKVVL